MNTSRNWVPGVVLLGFGVLGLLGNFGLMGAISTLVWALIFGFGALTFFAWYARDHQMWWTLIPGSALAGLSLTLLTGSRNSWAGMAFLGALGLGFLGVYATSRQRWWALIPAGSLITLALVTVAGVNGGAVFFFGLALTFAAVYWQPADAEQHLERHHWAIYPALACFGLAVISGQWFSGAWGIVWPILLIGIGAWLLRGGVGGSGRLKH